MIKIAYYQLNYIKFVLLCILFVSCNTQHGKVEFPLAETEFRGPKKVKATPVLRQIPDNLPYSKYTFESNQQLIERNQSIPLKTAAKKKAGQPRVTKSRLRGREVSANLKKQAVRTPKRSKAIGKRMPARGKVVMAEKPISKPFVPPAIRDDDNYGMQYIGQDQYLPGTVVNQVLEDSKGRIWIGVGNGLAMLEGEEMKIYTTQEGLINNNILSLMESATGAIWIGTDEGVNVFEDGCFIHYGSQEGFGNYRVTSLLESATGAIWIGTSGGVSVFENSHFTHYGIEDGLSNPRVTSLLEPATGVIWIGTAEGVNVFEEDSFLHYSTEDGLSSNSVWSLLKSTTGAIWVGTSKGVDVFEEGYFTHYDTEEGLGNHRITSLLESATGAICIGTSEGLDVFESNHFTHYGTEDGLSSSRIRSLFESASGNIWVGTYGEGVNIFELGRVTHYGTEEGLSYNRIRSLVESTTGAIWMGTDGQGLDVFESGYFTNYRKEDGLSSNRVFSILESATGAIWIGTDTGIDVFEDGHFTHYGTNEGLSNNVVWSLLESTTGAIWIGTSGGLNVFEDGHFTHYTTKEGLCSNNVYSLLESATGAIWIGTSAGVDVFGEGHFIHYGTEEGLSSNRVRSLLELTTGAIWIGTDAGGIDIFESGSFTHYDQKEGLSDKSAMQLSMDSLGNVWVGTSNGMTRFVAKKEGYQLTSWNKTHGLKYMDFNGPGNPMLFTKADKASRKGTMWSSIGGTLTVFQPPLEDTLTPTLFITGIDIKQKQTNWSRVSDIKEKMQSMKGINTDTLFFAYPDSLSLLSSVFPDSNSLTVAGISWSGTEDLAPYHLPQNLALPYDQNHLVFHYSAIKINEQSDVVYRYMLEGIDKGWSSFTQEGNANYRNIPPGQYTFRVRARGRNFIWSNEASISFVVYPPWWETWWARLLYVLIGSSLVFGFLRLRLSEYKKRQKKLENSDRRYRSLFEDSPTPTWEEDFSAVKKEIELLKRKGISDFEKYFNDQPELIFQFAKLIKINDINKEVLKMYGVQSKQVFLDSPPLFFSDEAINGIKKQLITIAVNKTSCEFDSGVVLPSGEKRYFHFKWAAVDGHEKTLDKVYLSNYDITARRSMEEELMKSNRELEVFFYRTSHDLRAPLARIMGLLQIIDLSHNLDEIKSYMSLIESSTLKLNHILGDLIEIIQIRQGQLKRSEVDIEQVVNDILEIHYPKENHAIEIRKMFESETVYSDPIYLKIILRNLISNALKFSADHKESYILIQISKTDKAIQIKVEDNGIGIREEAKNHLFEMFYRGGNENTEGVGLGLFIVKDAVNKLGGKIHFESKKNQGTTFYVELPID